MAKRVQKSPKSAIFGHILLFLGALKAPSSDFSSDSCRGGPKLRNEYSNIKIRQELTSEMRKI